MKKFSIIVSAIVLLLAGYYVLNLNGADVCGGIAGESCEEGYACRLTPGHPDATGKCVPDNILFKVLPR